MLLAAGAAPGCVTGHLIDSGLRYEKVERYESVCTDGERLIVGYVARMETARGARVSDRRVFAAVPLREIGSHPPPPIDTVSVEWIDEPTECQDLPLALLPGDGRPAGLVLEDGSAAPVTLYSGTFTRAHTALWIVPVLPFTVAVDAVAVVPLTVLALPYLFFEQ